MSPGRPPRTALVHDWLTGMRGGEKVLEAIAALFPGAPIYTLVHVPGSVSPAIEAHPIRPSFLQSYPFVERHYRRYLPLFPAAVEAFDLTGFELVVSTSHCAAKGVVPAPGAFHLCYCHTPMRYAWDQEHVYFPKRRGPVARLRNLALTALRTWDVASSARVDCFAANSRFVAERIGRYYRRSAEVVPPPVDTAFFTPAESPAADTPSKPFCLFVSALAPYKRIEVAIAACERLGLELRIVGEGPERRRLAERAGERASEQIRLLGRVEPETLRDLYRSALCFVQPGVEDFGISSVEALACGCPVVAAGRGGVLDVVRDGRDGVLFEEDGGVEAVASAIDKTRGMRFNSMDLRSRAEEFSAARFEDRFRTLLSSRVPGWA